MKRILVLFAHPSQSRSEVNVPLFKSASSVDAVTAVDLYAEYPTFNIDIEKEKQRLRDHDVVIFMFPLYWYSTPALLKEWQDLVLEYDFAYGENGRELEGKTFVCAITAGGKEEAYRREGYNNFTVRELLQPLEQTANLTLMRYLPPFVLFGARTATEEGRIEEHVASFHKLLDYIRDDSIDHEDTAPFGTLNEYIEERKGAAQ